METLKLLLSAVTKFFDWKSNKNEVDKYKSQSESLSKTAEALNEKQEEHRQEIIDYEKSDKNKRDWFENDW